jgi:hypothetical protein
MYPRSDPLRRLYVARDATDDHDAWASISLVLAGSGRVLRDLIIPGPFLQALESIPGSLKVA